MYDFPCGDGRGQTIAVIEFAGGYKPEDVAKNLELLDVERDPNTIEAVSVTNGKNSPGRSKGADKEVMLDLVVIGAIVPKAKIRVYFAPDTHQGWVAALMQAVLDGETTVISISWGATESYFGPQSIKQIERALKIAALRGITVCCASGDHGTTNGYQFRGGNAHLWYPASSPYVLSCGGTKTTVKKGSIKKEEVWNDGFLNAGSGRAFWATGGGVSEIHDVPVWQEKAMKATVSVNSGVGGRGVPDVAANAEKLWNIGSDTAGGTSAAAPLWAALIARLNGHLNKELRREQARTPRMARARAGFLNHLLYEAAWEKRGFRLVTQGSNEGAATPPGYTAGYRRWNACTGTRDPERRAAPGGSLAVERRDRHEGALSRAKTVRRSRFDRTRQSDTFASRSMRRTTELSASTPAPFGSPIFTEGKGRDRDGSHRGCAPQGQGWQDVLHPGEGARGVRRASRRRRRAPEDGC